MRPSPRLLSLIATATALVLPATARGDDEAPIFTPPGFDRPALPRSPRATTSLGGDHRPRRRPGAGPPLPHQRDGPDGMFYQPASEPALSLQSYRRVAEDGQGEPAGKAPVRYFGRFFYTTGTVTVTVPAGEVRVEVWKGLEYRPARSTPASSPAIPGESPSRSSARRHIGPRLRSRRPSPPLPPRDRTG